MKKAFSILILWIITLSIGFSQNSSISGKITNEKTGEELIGANVVIEGSLIGSTTNINGEYKINNLKDGIYSLKVSFISYEDKIINNVIIKNKSNIVIDIKLSETQYDLKGVNIQSKKITNTENSMLAIQKQSAGVLDGISSQQISLYGDKDAASSLKRVTGIVILDDKYINVRGLSDRYIKVRLNNSDIPSLDPNNNAPQLDLFPSNVIDNILVYKSFTPELPGDFTGAYVDIKTKEFPEKYTFQFNTSIGFNPQANLTNNFLSYEGGKLDWLGIDDGTRNIPTLAQGDVPYRYHDDSKLDDITASFNKIMEPTKQKSFLNHSHSISVGNQTKLFGKPFGFIISVNYDRKFSYYNDGEIGHYTLRTSNAPFLQKDLQMSDECGKMKILIGGIINMSYKLNDNNIIGFNVIRNQSGIDDARYQEGYSHYHQVDFQTRSLRFFQRSYTSVQLNGNHTISDSRKINLKWNSSYVISKHKEPDTRFFTNIYEIADDGSKVYFIDIAKQDVPSRYFRNLTEKAINNNFDITIPFEHLNPSFNIKAGGAIEYKKREFDERIFQYRDNNDSYNGNISAYLADTNIGTNIYNYPQFFGIFITDGTQLSNIYSGNQTIAAGYLMGDIKIIPKLRAVAGARTEYTYIYVKSENPKNPEGLLDVIYILPGINLTYTIIDNMNIRASYTKTLARPTFRELAPYSSFEFSGDFIFTGNPDLKATLIDNYDIKWEWFPESGEIFSVGYFYKLFHDPIERTFIPEAGNDEITFMNVNQSKSHGIEFDIRKKLDFANAFKNMKIGVNFAFIHTSVAIDDHELQAIHATNPYHSPTREMYGQAPFICNAIIGYNNEDKGISSNINYNISGKKLTVVVKGGTPNIYEQPRNQLDFNFKKTFNKKWTVKFSAKNLLNSPYKQTYTYKGKEYIFSNYKLGREYSIGFSYLI